MRQYLLGELTEADEQELEVRLLADPSFVDELDMAENDLIDSYVSDELPAEERARCEQYFLKSSAGSDKLDFTTVLSKQSLARRAAKSRLSNATTANIRKPHWFKAQYLKIAAMLLLVVGIGWAGWIWLGDRFRADDGLTDLQAAFKNHRLTESRITKLPFAPLADSRGQGTWVTNEDARARAELQALANLKNHPGAKSEHAAGRYYLAAGQLDKAISYLQEALKQQPDDALTNSDLGAAYVEQGRQALLDGDNGKGLGSLAQALTQINKALTINPNLLEALYNKALCLHYMKVPEEARTAWQDYLAHDQQSEWANEARRKLQSLGAQSVSPAGSKLLDDFLAAYRARDDDAAWKILSHNREPITGTMITSQLELGYVSSMLKAQKKSAQEILRAFLYAGNLERTRGEDLYSSDRAHHYASLSIAKIKHSSAALENLNEGYRLCLLDDYRKALQAFSDARNSFLDAADIQGATFAEYWISYCYTRTDRVVDSLRLLKQVAQLARQRNYKWLLAQAYGWLGTNHAIRSEYSLAINYDHESLKLAESLSDTYQMQKASTELSTLYAYVRQQDLSLKYLYQSLSLALEFGNSPRQTWRNFLYAAAALFDFKYYEAAAVFASEAIRLGKTHFKDASLNYMLRLKMGEIYNKLRRFDDALEQASLGLEIAQSVPESPARNVYTALSYLKIADITRENGQYDRATAFYNQALDLYQQAEFDLYRYAAYKGRLLCALALNDQTVIDRDLALLLSLSDNKRSQIREEQYRNSFFDTENDLYDIAIEHEHRNGNDVKAINYAESARSRSLLDALNSKTYINTSTNTPNVVSDLSVKPLNVESIRLQLPSELQILMYTVLPKSLLVAFITKDDFSVHEVPVDAATLEAEILSYTDQLRQVSSDSTQTVQETSKRLYQTLLGEVAAQLQTGKRLCIIPDKSLNYLSFASLISPVTGKYLIQDWPILYASSLNVLQRSSTIGSVEQTHLNDLSLLVIGNPRFNREKYPDLAPLESAEREVKSIAAFFTTKTVLLGPQATKQNVMRAMDSAQVIHFAGHYVVDDSTPLLSKMLLATHDGNDPIETDSVLYAHEIIRHGLGQARLIVLAACDTAIEKYYRGEGAVGLARSFLEAKVPLVVATQWSVDSEATTTLMTKFYQHRQRGLPTIEAMQQAQIELLQGSDTRHQMPYYWSGFICVGGNVDY